jgi:hypothetical protein
MVSSDVLTGEQGIRILVETLFFFIFYYLYLHMTHSAAPFFTNLIVTTFIFAAWALSVAIATNLTLAFNVKFPRSTTLHQL